jgi:hypothetical protein
MSGLPATGVKGGVAMDVGCDLAIWPEQADGMAVP